MYKIFVYGTLKSNKIQKELFGKELKKHKAILNDYSLYEAEDGWFFIQEKQGNFVPGYIIELDDRCLQICDAFEYCPEMYERRNISVMVDQKTVDCFVYFRIDEIKKYKEITDNNSFSRYSEEDVINTEIKQFKELEHPEFYELK